MHASFRVEIGNWGWNWAAGAPFSSVSELVDKRNVFGKELRSRLASEVPRQFRIGWEAEQLPEAYNRVTIDPEYRDALGNYRPVIYYNLPDYTRAGLAKAKKVSDQIFPAPGSRGPYAVQHKRRRLLHLRLSGLYLQRRRPRGWNSQDGLQPRRLGCRPQPALLGPRESLLGGLRQHADPSHLQPHADDRRPVYLGGGEYLEGSGLSPERGSAPEVRMTGKKQRTARTTPSGIRWKKRRGGGRGVAGNLRGRAATMVRSPFFAASAWRRGFA